MQYLKKENIYLALQLMKALGYKDMHINPYAAGG